MPIPKQIFKKKYPPKGQSIWLKTFQAYSNFSYLLRPYYKRATKHYYHSLWWEFEN
jgi:hypothetical protein